MEKENGLKFFRFLTLISSINPVFILLAIKGAEFSNDKWNIYFRATLLVIALISFIPLIIVYICAKRQNVLDKKVFSDIVPCTGEYSSYIISIALPLCQNEISNINDLVFCIAMLSFIVFIFYIFNLYYLNIFFYTFGYRLYKVENEKETYVIISQKSSRELKNTSVNTLRLTNSLFLEIGE